MKDEFWLTEENYVKIRAAGQSLKAGKNLAYWEMQGWWSKGSTGEREEGRGSGWAGLLSQGRSV